MIAASLDTYCKMRKSEYMWSTRWKRVSSPFANSSGRDPVTLS